MKSIWTVAILSSLLPLHVFSQEQAVRAYDIYDSIGVNTHWYFGNGYQYQPNFSYLANLMSQNHIMHFRDGVYSEGTNTPPYVTQMYSTLAGKGIHAELIVPSGKSVADLEAGLKYYPGVEAIEPPNEADITEGSNWVSSLLSEEPAIYTAGHDLGLTVLGPALTQTASYSLLGDVARYMAFNNLHLYFDGRNPENTGWGGPDAEANYYGAVPFDLDSAGIDGPGRGNYVTETGYQTAQDNLPQGVVPEWVAGTYAPRIILHFFKSGIKRTYFYELVDDPAQGQPGYGLLRHDLSPKPAFTAIRNLQSILQDNSTSFTPGQLDYSLTGDTSGVETVLLQKSAGQFWLAVWLNGPVYDVNAAKATPIPSRPLTLNISNGMVANYIASFDANGNVQGSNPNQSNLQLNVNSAVTLVRIDYPGR